MRSVERRKGRQLFDGERFVDVLLRWLTVLYAVALTVWAIAGSETFGATSYESSETPVGLLSLQRTNRGFVERPQPSTTTRL